MYCRSSLALSIATGVLTLGSFGCSPSGGTLAGSSGTGGPAGTGGVTGAGGVTAGSGGATGSGGKTTGSGGATGSGGKTGFGGATGAGGTNTGTGGSTGTGGTTSNGGAVGDAGRPDGVGTRDSRPATTGGISGRDGGPGSAGAPGTGGAAIDGGASTVDCSATMPTGGTVCSGNNCNGQADGLGYGIWESGSGGSITYFTNAHAFSASWGPSSADFLAHLGLDFNASKSYTAYGTIAAQFSEIKTGSSGGWSSIGMYGWMHSPCIEWYINEDSFNGMGGGGGATATIDGATYSLSSTTTNGTGGANACESGHSGSWTQIHSYRKTARQCGTITVSDHFAAWAAQGWNLGSLASVHINVEVGGGTGSIQFPVANVTTTSK